MPHRLQNARDYVERLSPPWLAGFFGTRFMIGMVGVVADLLLEAVEQATTVGWLNRKTLPVDALKDIGENANIQRVTGETNDNYKSRLFRKWELWEESATSKFAENSFTPFGVAAADITLKTTRDWVVDDSPNWSRWWIILDGSAGNLPWSELLWNGFAWGTPGTTWGTTATQEEIFGVIRLLCKWKSAHEIGVEIIILYGATLWGHGDPWGSPRTWNSSTDIVRWPLGRFWGSAYTPKTWGTSKEPYRPQFDAVWGGKIRV